MNKTSVILLFDDYVKKSLQTDQSAINESNKSYWRIESFLTAEEKMALSILKAKLIYLKEEKEVVDKFTSLCNAIRSELERRL